MSHYKIITIVLVLIYTSCKNDDNNLRSGTPADISQLSKERSKMDSIIRTDSPSNNKESISTGEKKLNTKEIFDPSTEPSSIIPKHPTRKQMPLPGGVPNKHYIDSVKASRNQK